MKIGDIRAYFIEIYRQLDKCRQVINSIRSKIKFRTESEKDNKPNFLDITIRYKK